MAESVPCDSLDCKLKMQNLPLSQPVNTGSLKDGRLEEGARSQRLESVTVLSSLHPCGVHWRPQVTTLGLKLPARSMDGRGSHFGHERGQDDFSDLKLKPPRT